MKRSSRLKHPPINPLGFLLFSLMVSLLPSCKSTPALPPSEEPSALLNFTGPEAASPEYLTLNFSLEIKNPLPFAGQVTIESWKVELNGKKADVGFNLEKAEALTFPVTAADSGTGVQSIPLALDMDVSTLAAHNLAPADEYRVRLILELSFSRSNETAQGSFPSVKAEVSGAAVFPGVQPPAFSISTIAILKAELVNTRFRVGLRIDNPNPYPVDLSAFSYELYGNGRLWADGTEKDVIKVPAKSSADGNLFLIMNFINMKRDLLDQIIRLEDVNYRFAGEAQVSTGVGYLPKFKTGFVLSGYSKVYDN